MKEYTLDQVKRHKTADSVWMVIHNDVYDVTKFLNEHPGGADSLMDVAGQEATQAFEDVGHSDDAREMMKQYKIGTLPPNEHSVHIALPIEKCNWWKWALLLLAGAVIAGVAYKKLKT